MLFLETTIEEMRNVAYTIFENFDTGYYLAGGTALALRIGHRKSIDLDYFSASPIDTGVLKEKINEIFSSAQVEILFEEKNTLWCMINGVKVSFISRLDPLLESPETDDYFRLAGIKDITVMKLRAVCGREEYKDFFDLACTAEKTDVRSWVLWWQEIYPKQDITSWVVALSAVDTIQRIPLEILEGFKDKDVSGNIKRAVQEITKQVWILGDS